VGEILIDNVYPISSRVMRREIPGLTSCQGKREAFDAAFHREMEGQLGDLRGEKEGASWNVPDMV